MESLAGLRWGRREKKESRSRESSEKSLCLHVADKGRRVACSRVVIEGRKCVAKLGGAGLGFWFFGRVTVWGGKGWEDKGHAKERPYFLHFTRGRVRGGKGEEEPRPEYQPGTEEKTYTIGRERGLRGRETIRFSMLHRDGNRGRREGRRRALPRFFNPVEDGPFGPRSIRGERSSGKGRRALFSDRGEGYFFHRAETILAKRGGIASVNGIAGTGDSFMAVELIEEVRVIENVRNF